MKKLFAALSIAMLALSVSAAVTGPQEVRCGYTGEITVACR